jgi:hypothetical protein
MLCASLKTLSRDNAAFQEENIPQASPQKCKETYAQHKDSPAYNINSQVESTTAETKPTLTLLRFLQQEKTE